MYLKPLHRVLVERRMPRHFSDPTPPDDVLQMILHAGLQAPSSYRIQPARFVVVRDSRKRARLRRAAMNEPCVGEAPVVIVAFGRTEEWREAIDDIYHLSSGHASLNESRLEPQRQRVNEHLERTPVNLWLHRHVTMAFTCMMLTAEALGWDTNLVERFDPLEVSTMLGLPEDAEIVAMLAIGRAAAAETPEHDPDAWSDLVYADHYGEPWR